MPAFRNVRRSRRISRQPPRDPTTDEYDIIDLNLMYPEQADAPPPFRTATPDAVLPPAPEPDTRHLSPPLAPTPAPPPPPQRSSHSRKRKSDHIPRPPNSFMMFRSELWNKEKIKPTVERDHRQISRIAGRLWHGLNDDERQPYHLLADEAKRNHARLYPQYKYSPVYRRDKPAKRKPKSDDSHKVHRAHQVARLVQRGFEGDELEQEMRKRATKGDEGYASDGSEYVDAPRRKKTRTSSIKKGSPAPRRRSRHRKIDHTSDGEDAPITVKIGDSPSQYAFPKQESCPPEENLAGFPSALGDEYVPTADIPHFSLGDPAYDFEEVQFTNPFASGSCLPPMSMTTFSSQDPLSPASGPPSLSDGFLGSVGDEQHPQLSSPDALVGIFDVSPDPTAAVFDDLNSIPIFEPNLDQNHPYYATQCLPEQAPADTDFHEWVREDSYE